jgi:hypothetical protein
MRTKFGLSSVEFKGAAAQRRVLEPDIAVYFTEPKGYTVQYFLDGEQHTVYTENKKALVSVLDKILKENS